MGNSSSRDSDPIDPRSPTAQRTPIPSVRENVTITKNTQGIDLFDPRSPKENRTPLSSLTQTRVIFDPRSPLENRTPIPSLQASPDTPSTPFVASKNEKHKSLTSSPPSTPFSDTNAMKNLEEQIIEKEAIKESEQLDSSDAAITSTVDANSSSRSSSVTEITIPDELIAGNLRNEVVNKPQINYDELIVYSDFSPKTTRAKKGHQRSSSINSTTSTNGSKRKRDLDNKGNIRNNEQSLPRMSLSPELSRKKAHVTTSKSNTDKGVGSIGKENQQIQSKALAAIFDEVEVMKQRSPSLGRKAKPLGSNGSNKSSPLKMRQ